MNFEIKKINRDNFKDINVCDSKFMVYAELELEIFNGDITYIINELPFSYEKHYPNDDINYEEYIDNPDKTVFLAYMDEEVAGQIILRRNWNKYAYIEDIRVKSKFRRKKIGQKLMNAAIGWAKENNMLGIMLETQNNNVDACKFYKKCGFVLGGLDKYLYNGIGNPNEEVALYWYFIF
jgi:ribosomal protein S18 acetylase RimI-like enzyme